MSLLADFPRLWPSPAAAPRPTGVAAARAADRPDPAGQQRLLKGINRMTLVRQLCAKPGLSRADLAASVQLTKSTVSLLVRELITEGWLLERDCVATGDIGRRPTPLFIDPTRLVLLGAEIGIESTRLVATSLVGDVLASTQVQHADDRGADACVARLAASLCALRRQLRGVSQEVIGIGIGLPGGVDETTGLLHFAPNLGWRGVAVGALLQSALAGSELAGVALFVPADRQPRLRRRDRPHHPATGRSAVLVRTARLCRGADRHARHAARHRRLGDGRRHRREPVCRRRPDAAIGRERRRPPGHAAAEPRRGLRPRLHRAGRGRRGAGRRLRRTGAAHVARLLRRGQPARAQGAPVAPWRRRGGHRRGRARALPRDAPADRGHAEQGGRMNARPVQPTAGAR
ncbi:MAG: ROK family protein [Burkholderiales bacterium]|nr:ROK family protein [Burkholderiales bacterium]